MDTVKSQLIIDEHVMHNETDSAVVIYRNTTAKEMLDNVISTADLPPFMQNFLQSENLTEANQTIHTVPVPYFDDCFNTWTVSGTPTLESGDIIMDGKQYLQCTPGWTLGKSDFTVEAIFSTNVNNAANGIFSAYNTAGSAPSVQLCLNTSGQLRFWSKYSGSNMKAYMTAYSIATEQKYKVAWTFDYDSTTPANSTCNMFVDGIKEVDSQNLPLNGTMKTFRIGADYGATAGNKWNGTISEIRVSNINRYKNQNSINMPDRLEYDEHCLICMHFDN